MVDYRTRADRGSGMHWELQNHYCCISSPILHQGVLNKSYSKPILITLSYYSKMIDHSLVDKTPMGSRTDQGDESGGKKEGRWHR